MKRQQVDNAANELSNEQLETTNFIINAINTYPDVRSKAQVRCLKNYVMNRMVLMESKYCSKDDYTFATEMLKYRFVPQGHYVVRQGEIEADVYFIIKGSAKVIMKGVDEPGKYLDEKQRYNEISVLKAKIK